MRSLSLGFGPEVQRQVKPNEKLYRAWELGTYRSAWRVVRDGKVLLGSQDTASSNEDLNIAFQRDSTRAICFFATGREHGRARRARQRSGNRLSLHDQR